MLARRIKTYATYVWNFGSSQFDKDIYWKKSAFHSLSRNIIYGLTFTF